MLLKYLTELKNSLPANEFRVILQSVEANIKVNRIAFNKRTSSKEFIVLCEILKEAIAR